MKLRFSLVLLMLTLFSASRIIAQQTPMAIAKTEIKPTQIQTTKRGPYSVMSVDAKTLAKGVNYLKLATGDTLSVTVQKGKITSYTLTSKTGQVKGTAVVKSGALEFACNRSFCSCAGDADCNDMFTTNVCGPNAVCFGDICVCMR